MDQPNMSRQFASGAGYADKLAKTDSRIRDLQEKLSCLFESATDGILVLDLNGIIREINPRVRDVLGRPDQDILGRPFFDFIRPEDLTVVKDAWILLRQRGIFQQLEFRVQKADSSLVWCEENASTLKDESGDINGYVVIARDITNRKLAQEKLRQSELEFLQLFEAMTEGVALLDTSGRVVRTNSAEARILGLGSASQRIGQPFRCASCTYYKADGSELALEEMAAYLAMKKKRRISNSEIKIVRPDHSAVWCNLHADPIVNGSGKITGAVHTSIDITEQKKLKDDREKYLAEITRVQEEERKRLSRELHDETAQSLSLLILELDAVCQKKNHVPPDVQERLQQLRETAQNTLNEVRRYSHELRPSILDNLGLIAALESLVEDLNRERHLKSRLHVSGDLVRLPNEVELALFRIAQESLSNIRKHSGATKARVNLRYSRRQIKLRIIDNGQGFDTREMNNFAEAGHLGLVGMKERANLIKGTFQLKSNIGEGTTVSVEVPLLPGSK